MENYSHRVHTHPSIHHSTKDLLMRNPIVEIIAWRFVTLQLKTVLPPPLLAEVM